MPIEIKEKQQLVSSVIDRLKPLLPENVDYSEGKPLKNIIEAIMEELDIQYWQLEQAYNSAYIDDAIDTDLDKLVALLGVIRYAAVKSKGVVTFFRSTPADSDYFIPEETLVETFPDSSGISVTFKTTKDVTLEAGQTEVDVEVEAEIAGVSGNVSALTIKMIKNPPVGIESVKNTGAIGGGENTETDEDLRERTKHVLDTIGLGTVDALYFKVKIISGVRQVTVMDMARGIGTVDILVLTDAIPMIESKRKEIEKVIYDSKAGGIDISLLEPVVIPVNVHVEITVEKNYSLSDVYNGVERAIINYVNNLNIGETLILNQLRKYILNSSELIKDIAISSPVGNITIEPTEIVRIGNINIE